MTFEFAIGDRIKLCKNDYRLNVSNGTLGTVTHIDPVTEGHYRITLRTDDQRTVRIDTRDYADEQSRTYMALAYALTVYASQGCTVDDTFVYYSGSMDRAHSYVAGSRHREQCRWFINAREMQALAGRQPTEPMLTAQERVQTLARCMSVNRHKQLAIEYVSEPASPPPERTRERHHELELA
jgi:ATP-dependent exoDNAse (exonuclease V) alpha subunit